MAPLTRALVQLRLTNDESPQGRSQPVPGKTLVFVWIFYFFGSKLKFGKTQTFSEQSLVSPDHLFGKQNLKIKQEKKKKPI